MATAQQAIDKAASYKGYVEGGGSSGHNGNITIFWEKYAPALQGQPWCAIFMHDVQDEIGMPLPFLYTYVPNLTAHAKRTGRQVFTPQPGDIALYWNGEHTGLVATPADGNGYFYAWEGNTSPTDAGSQSNGGGVYYKRRHVSDAPDGFYRPPYAETPPAPSQEDQLFSPSPANTGHIIASHSGLMLDGGGLGNFDGSNVAQWPSDGGLDQRWQLVGHEDGTVSFVNRYGYALDVPGNDGKPGTHLWLHSANYTAAQRFTILGDRPLVVIRHAASGLNVDIAAASLDPGAPALLWTPTANRNQVFVLAGTV